MKSIPYGMLFILLWNYFSFKNPERVMKYLLTICVAIISFSSAAQAKNHIDLKKLNSSWISSDGKKYQVVIKDSKWIDYYDKQKTASLHFTIRNNIITALDNHTNDIYKYSIVYVNNKSLILINLDRGNTLSFKRG